MSQNYIVFLEFPCTHTRSRVILSRYKEAQQLV